MKAPLNYHMKSHQRPTLFQGRPFFIVFIFLLTARICAAQDVVLTEETKKLANQVMLNIYYDVLAAKEKYPELAQFNEKTMYENKDGIYAIVYQFQPEGKLKVKEPFEFGITIVPKANTIFQDQGQYAFNLEFPFLGLKFAGYAKKGLKQKFDIVGLINKHGILLADYQQKYLPLQLQVVANKSEYNVKEPIQFQVELKNVSKKHMYVENINEGNLYCLFNNHSWGAQSQAGGSKAKIILRAGESLKRTYIGVGLPEPKDVEIYCSYSMSLNGVKPSGVLRLRVKK